MTIPKQIVAREILSEHLDNIWYLNEIKRVNLTLDDETIVTSGRAVILSWMVWRFHRTYRQVPLVSAHVFPLKKYTDDTTLNHVNKVMWDTYDCLNDEVAPYTLINMAGEIVNDIFNLIVSRMGEYVGTSSALDYYEILEDTEIQRITATAERSPDGLKVAKDTIKKRLQDPELYRGNNLKFICETGITNWSQLLQIIAFRGYCTDINSNFYDEPIMSAYAHGITNLAHSIMESRMGAKSIMANEDPIRQTEYFNRRMQLILQYIKDLIPGDCGTTKYLHIPVTGPESYKGGIFEAIIGKYQVMKDGSLHCITENDTHLIGQTIRIRSSVYCKHRSKYGICETCFGSLAINVPDGTNIGHWCSVALCAIITQLILSTKHVDGAAAVAGLHMTPNHRRYLRNEGVKLYFKRLKDKKIIITIHKDDLNFLEDLRVFPVSGVKTISRMTAVTIMNVTVQDHITGMSNFAPLDLRLGKAPVHLSVEMLEHIKMYGWTNTETGDYQIDVTEFDFDKPVIVLPKLHRNMLEFMRSVSEFIESKYNKKSKHSTLDDYVDPGEALIDFHALISGELSLGLASLEPFILAFMAKSEVDGRIPDVGEECTFLSTGRLIKTRSCSVGMAYEKQDTWMESFRSLSNKCRPPHPLDGLLMPTMFNR